MSINKMFFMNLFLVSALCGCANDWFITHKGNMPTNERISKIEVGQSKQFVEDVLGAPSSIVSLDQNSWIYMSSEIEQVAFLKPQEIKRDILTIKFGDHEQVVDIQHLSKENGKVIRFSQDETPTLGQKPGFFEKYFGGVGQYMPFAPNKKASL